MPVKTAPQEVRYSPSIAFAKLLSVMILLYAVLVILDWIFMLGIQQMIYPKTITMKFMTAISFVFASAIIFSIAEVIGGRTVFSKRALPVSNFLLTLMMICAVIFLIFPAPESVKYIFLRESPGMPGTIYPGGLSALTIIAFILTLIAGLLTQYYPAHLKQRLLWIGSAVMLIGIIPLVGYIFGMPALYYSLGRWTNPIAFTTAFLFTLTGMSLVLLSKDPHHTFK